MSSVSEQAPASEGTVMFRLVPPGPEAELDVPLLYANFVQATMSPLDLTFHFGWYGLPASPGLAPGTTGDVEVPVRPLAKVTVPLPLVRAVIRVLEAQLQNWEQTFGSAVPDQPVQPGLEP